MAIPFVPGDEAGTVLWDILQIARSRSELGPFPWIAGDILIVLTYPLNSEIALSSNSLRALSIRCGQGTLYKLE